MEEAVQSSRARSWKNATEKRKAFARSRDSWQVSEAEDMGVRTGQSGDNTSNLELANTSSTENGISNKKIEIWLQDCGTPMGVSLDEQSHPTLKGSAIKHGSSFEDDLSLGAEANYLHSNGDSAEAANYGTSAKEKRRQFCEMGRSMNSTGSGKSSTTVSSVSELLDLYEEDPEEVLYNLGFGTDEPDLASKIPPRFFSATSFARGIDFKLFLDTQMQRLELDNPNFALTSRFRQIKVLTTVANVFSSLYSHVSGNPLQQIGGMCEIPPGNPVPIVRNSAANKLKKTVSKLSLHGAQQIKSIESNNQETPSGTGNEKTSEDPETNNISTENDERKGEIKLKKEGRNHKWRITADPLLKPVSEEILGANDKPLKDSVSVGDKSMQSDSPLGERQLGVSDGSCIDKNSSTSTDVEQTRESVEIVSTEPHCSTPEKGPAVLIQHPMVKNLMEQQKEFSFELEEVQSNEGEGLNTVNTTSNPGPSDSVLVVSGTNKRHFTRTASSHSDSSGFAEDPSTDMLSHYQGQDASLQAMGSSADSCDSETTVTSFVDDIKTPLSCDQSFFTPSQTPMDNVPMDLFEGDICAPGLTDSNEQGELESDSAPDVFLQPGEQGFWVMMIRNVRCRLKRLKTPRVMGTLQVKRTFLRVLCISWGNKNSTVWSRVCWNSERESLSSDTSTEKSNVSSPPANRVTTALERPEPKQSISASDMPSLREGRPVAKASHGTIQAREKLYKRDPLAKMKRNPFQRSSSLPTTLLSPVRVVSSLNIHLSPDSDSQCDAPSFTYKYSPLEEDSEATNSQDEKTTKDEPVQLSCRSTLFIPSSRAKKERSTRQVTLNQGTDETSHCRLSSQTFPMASHLSQSSCSLHSIASDWQDRPLCEHMRAWSTCSVPNLMESPHRPFASQTHGAFASQTHGAFASQTHGAFASPFAHLYPPRPVAHNYRHFPVNPPSVIETQLRRVLYDIRGTLQNLSQIPMLRGNGQLPAHCASLRSNLIPLYEATFQELQVMRRNLNYFRTQMMDLELVMLRQQTMVYQHLTEEERQEADQLQNLRNYVRMELQELEVQLEERSYSLEEQLRTPQQFSQFRPQPHTGMFAGSMDGMSSASLDVMEPVTELLREQSSLRSELGFSEPSRESFEYTQSCPPYTNLEALSRCSSPGRMSRFSSPSTLSLSQQPVLNTTERSGKATNPTTSSTRNKQVYRSSVMLTPATPARGEGSISPETISSRTVNQKSEPPRASPFPGAIGKSIVEHPEFQNVLQEIKDSIVGEIKREIVDQLLAAVSSGRTAVGEQEESS
ncbi:LOW QUALITY PROTEIN: protein ITPRID2 [Callorhinchus milii]|uniref:LOW QUALITY PROTEIN: protein ITPRID2 n=1 Tax=Callorhinchus milii TaxID=7868 RepID=UPI001C3FB9C9|nr:LOW QUALITY PROTEIN: protein ITPRID2 [Callorhinchus milii]